MNDWIQTIALGIFSLTTMLVSYFITRRKETAEIGKSSAEQNGIKADTAAKYRAMLNEEIERRRKAETELDQCCDSFRDLLEQNDRLKDELEKLKGLNK